MTLRAYESDEHLLRSVETLFAFGPCRLCGGTFPSDNHEGHLDYHRELFDQYSPERRALERAVLAQEEELGLRLIADTPGASKPTAAQVARHEKFYGPVPNDVLAAMGASRGERREPELPSALAKRRKRRIATAEVSR